MAYLREYVMKTPNQHKMERMMSLGNAAQRKETKTDKTLVTVLEENTLSDANSNKIDDSNIRSGKLKEGTETKNPEIILTEHENNLTSTEPSNVTSELLNKPQILITTLDTDGRKTEMMREEVDRTQNSNAQHNLLTNEKNQTFDENKVNKKVYKDDYIVTIEPTTILGT